METSKLDWKGKLSVFIRFIRRLAIEHKDLLNNPSHCICLNGIAVKKSDKRRELSFVFGNNLAVFGETSKELKVLFMLGSEVEFMSIYVDYCELAGFTFEVEEPIYLKGLRKGDLYSNFELIDHLISINIDNLIERGLIDSVDFA